MRASTAQLQYDAAMPSSAAERRGILVHMEVVLRFSSSFDKVVHEVANCAFHTFGRINHGGGHRAADAARPGQRVEWGCGRFTLAASMP